MYSADRRNAHTTMDRRRRLSFDDSVIARADELAVGDMFVDQAIRFAGEAFPTLRIRTVAEVGIQGEDVYVRTEGGLNFWTSPGNTFLMVDPSIQSTIDPE